MSPKTVGFLRWLWGVDELVGARALLRSTPAVWIILALMVVVSVVDFALPPRMGINLLTHYLGDATANIANGQVWRLLTPELINPGFFGDTRYISGAEHLATNVIGLVLAGVHVERALGTRRFVALYVLAGLASQVALFQAFPLGWNASGGSSGSVHGVFGAVLIIAFAERTRSRGKFWYFVVAWTAITGVAVSALLNTARTNVVHLGGATVGIVLAAAWMLGPRRATRVALAATLAIVVASTSIVVPRSAGARRMDEAVVATVPMDVEPALITFAFGSLWVTVNGSGTLTRIDPATRRIVTTIERPRVGGGMVAAGGSLWVTGDSSVVEIDPNTHSALSKVPVPGDGAWGLAATPDAIWAALPDKASVARIDRRTRKVRLTPVGEYPYFVLAEGNAVWTTSYRSRTVSRLDPDSGEVVDRVRLPTDPYWVTAAAGSLWVGGQETVYRLDAVTLDVQAKVALGQQAWTMAADESGNVWVTERYGFEVSRINTRTNRVDRRVRVGLGQPNGIAAGDSLWVADSHRRAVLEVRP